jgi:hypothetical protein
MMTSMTIANILLIVCCFYQYPDPEIGDVKLYVSSPQATLYRSNLTNMFGGVIYRNSLDGNELLHP